MSNSRVFGNSTFCVITGASKGIGRAISIGISQKLGEKSHIVITARCKEGLDETKRLIECASPLAQLHVRVVVGELGNSAGLTSLAHAIFDKVEHAAFKHAMIIHNAGSIGDTSKKISLLDDVEQLQQHNLANVTSAHVLTAKFLVAFPNAEGLQRTVVQLSSVAGVTAFGTWSMYCVCKAARDMLFSVLAEEEPDVRVLSYAPGPIDTDMLRKGVAETGDLKTCEMLKKIYTDCKIVKVEDTVVKLLQILEKNEFKSGIHASYFDQ